MQLIRGFGQGGPEGVSYSSWAGYRIVEVIALVPVRARQDTEIVLFRTSCVTVACADG